MNNRYSEIKGDFAREIVLLKGKPCSYGKCKFCNYTLDNELDESKAISFNKEVLKNVSGKYRVLEVINSGNVFDLPESSLYLIRDIVKDYKIEVLYFESFLNEVKRFDMIREFFTGIELRFRIGLETFDDQFRKILGKGFIFEKQKKLLVDNYYSACLMICLKGQTKDMILNDLIEVKKYFKMATINVFVTNNTGFETDFELKDWFIKEVYPTIKDDLFYEILIDNKDLGVFEQ